MTARIGFIVIDVFSPPKDAFDVEIRRPKRYDEPGFFFSNSLERMNGKIENLLRLANKSDAPNSSVANSMRVLATEIEAESVFSRLKENLLSVEYWNVKSAIMSFTLYNSKGAAQSHKIAAVGDYIEISTPGSGKADWVRISEITDAPDETVLTVQPSRDPTDKSGAATVSHFFAADSTNNFCLQKKGSKINFYVIGLDEQTNTEDTGGIVE